MPLTIDLGERTLTGTSKGDGIRWRTYGLTWSRGRGCWVWPRTTRPETVRLRAEQIARDHDAEIIGEASAVEIDADERDLHIAERHDRAAERARADAAAADATFRQISDAIPLGQPILVGHHSERRHRRDLERQHNALGKMVERTRDADEHDKLADAARARIAERAERGVAEPVPRELMAAGQVVEIWLPGGSRRRYRIAKVNRKTLGWREGACSGSRPIDQAYRLWDADGRQLWPEHENEPLSDDRWVYGQ